MMGIFAKSMFAAISKTSLYPSKVLETLYCPGQQLNQNYSLTAS